VKDVIARGEAIMPEEARAAVAAARPLLVRAAWFSLGVNLLVLTGPVYMLQLYDRVLASRSVATLAVLTLLVIGLFIAYGVLDFARTALVARAAARFDAALSPRAFAAAVDAARISTAKAGETPVRDLRTLRQTLGGGALLAFFDAPFTPVFLLLIFLMHWALGLVALLGAAALVALAILNERQSRKGLAAALEAQTASDAAMTGILRNAAAADAMGMRGALHRLWARHAMNAAAAGAAAGDRINAYAAATKSTRLLLQSLILGAGALLAVFGEVTPGVMIAASIIAGRALAPVESAVGQWRAFGTAIAAWRRLKSFLEAAPKETAKITPPAPSGHLRLERVYCQPAGAKKPVLKGVSVEALPGEALGIIGPSGAGKSTLARAMVGVERVVSGEARLDGADLLSWNREEIGRHIGYLPQESELFEGTIADNIARFRADRTDDAVIKAATAAGAMQMILALPDGFETDIGERGARLSVGQRQRIGLARALYGDPVLVVLDEPNSNLDAEGEAALSNAILALKERRATVVVVAHRPSAITHVDKLLMLVDGEVRAFGPRDEVLNKIAPGRVAAIGGARKPLEMESNAQSSRTPDRAGG
jgi:ATP-binding cassette, subfamily C, bacterial EexD